MASASGNPVGGYADTANPQPTASSSDFEPILLFFYGTLRIPSVLQRITRLQEEPVLTPAEISGYKIKLWGPYPALVKCEASTLENPSIIKGFTWEAPSKPYLDRLTTYEGPNYAMESLAITQISPDTGEKTEKQGGTFVWNGDPEKLKDGEFNPDIFHKR
ncbi:hypothetical protein TWF281_000499 [Arthrobotrys megalospora]